MKDLIRLKLKQGKYIELEEICKEIDAEELQNLMLELAYEMESINVYGFVRYMIEKERKESWIRLAINIMLNPLCFIEGAYSIGLFHARELLAIDRNVENLERLLFFYNIPEKLIDYEEASSIAEELLLMESDNEVALELLDFK